jgi:hypothetical protein
MYLINILNLLMLGVILLVVIQSCVEMMMDGRSGMLEIEEAWMEEEEGDLQPFGYGSSQISKLRIFISISRFISFLMSFGLNSKALATHSETS